MNIVKEIDYNRETRDYTLLLNGDVVGFARTYQEGEVELDRIVYDLLNDGLLSTDLEDAAVAAEVAEALAEEATPAPVLPAQVTIDLPGMTYRTITVYPGDTAIVAERNEAGQAHAGLLINDVKFVPLVMVKHIIGREHYWETLNQARDLVDAAANPTPPDDAPPPPAAALPVPTPPAPTGPTITYVHVDTAALEVAYTAAVAAHPDVKRGWGKAVRAAYAELTLLAAEGGVVTFLGEHLLTVSSNTKGQIYLSNGTCSCPAGLRAVKEKRPCVCKHRARRQLVARMQQAQRRTPAAPLVTLDVVARRAEAEALMNECFA